MIFIFDDAFFSARFLESTLGRSREKYDRQDLTILISPVRNNFIKNLFMAKSREYWRSVETI